MKLNIVLNICCLLLAAVTLAACVPSEIENACKRKAVRSGLGKCSVNKGRQNAYGIWVVKLDCSRGVASCLNNTAGRVDVSAWTSLNDHLYEN